MGVGLGRAKNIKACLFQDRGAMPTDNAEAGLADNTDIQGKYVDQVTVALGVISVQYGNSAHAVIGGKHLELTPDVSSPGSVQWNCATSGTEIENKHLPAACRTAAAAHDSRPVTIPRALSMMT